ncbi:Putative ribonuclease H protein [Dendrobium catenatum]|uniref:Ribonuclease H protein n=1 Tax=Dendrobium catenatum TaxID=906689 RepID=A0A2I0XIF9_9ASPA|nr:Putative ribonuclease H protein [Dendrobium catenatum]
MLAKGFPPIFISWIKACISDVHFSVSINGSLQGVFSSTSGLRQGCPLSPDLFTIAMDGLSECFEEANHLKFFSGIPLGNFTATHLLYADDLLVFSKASLDEASCLKEILGRFAASSGLNINPAKSSILFSKNCQLGEEISDLLNIPQTDRPLKYLGLPIFFKRLPHTDYQPLIKKVTKALEGWKVKLLSFGGRIQFLRFTIFNTIAYWIRGSILPKFCLKILNKLCSRFLYGRDIAARKLHLIAWKDTCLPKANGGLGLPSLDSLAFNFSCSMIRRFLNEKGLLFSCWRNLYVSLWSPIPKRCSPYWNHLSHISLHIKHCLQLQIQPSSFFSLIWDPWCFGKSLMDLRDTNTNYSWLEAFKYTALSTIICNGQWVVPVGWPHNIKNLILSMPILVTETSCLWHNYAKVSNKHFTKEFFRQHPVVSWHRFIWHKHSSIRFSSFGWLAMKNGLKTSDNLICRGLQVNPRCIFCQDCRDTITHLFFECDFSFGILNLLIPQSQTLLLRPNLYQIFDFIEDIADTNDMLHFYCLLINASIYHIWRARNDRTFGNILECHTTVAIKIKKALFVKLENWKNGCNLKHLLA